jgi:hypothetical protein
MKWTDNFLGRRTRRERAEKQIKAEAERIAGEIVGHAMQEHKKFRQAFKGILTRRDAELLSDIGAKRRLAHYREEDERYGSI